jgi:hypothetical protein
MLIRDVFLTEAHGKAPGIKPILSLEVDVDG